MKDEGNVGAAPWRWRTGWLNRRDHEINNGSSSGTVDEGRRGVAVDDVVGEEAPAGWQTEQGVGLRRGFSRPRCMNGWADGMAVGNHGLETRLSEMWGKLRKYPPTDLRRFFWFRGTTGISCVGISQEVGVFARVVISE